MEYAIPLRTNNICYCRKPILRNESCVVTALRYFATNFTGCFGAKIENEYGCDALMYSSLDNWKACASVWEKCTVNIEIKVHLSHAIV